MKFNLFESIFVNEKVIAVKNKQDVLKAYELLEKIGITVFSSEKSKDKFIETRNDIKNNFLVNDDDGWRIQSHYIADGMSIEELETKINIILLKNPDIKKDSDEIKKLILKVENKIIDTENKVKIKLKNK